MNQEAFLEWELRAFQIREGFRNLRPPDRQKRIALDHIFKPYAEEIIQAVRERGPLVRQQLAYLRKEVMDTGENPSRPQVCSRYLLQGIVVPLQDTVFDTYREGGPEDFVFWHDVRFGVNYVLSRIVIAESSIRGDADRQAIEGIDSVQRKLGVSASLSRQTEAYLRMTSEATGAELLLRQDPSGFLLIEETLKQLRNPRSRTHDQKTIMESLVPDYILAGAGFAQKAYRQIYPLSDTSTTENPKS